MKTLIFIVIVGVLAAVLLGCMPAPAPKPPDHPQGGLGLSADALTGCQYLTNGHSITPRMGADGKQICKEMK